MTPARASLGIFRAMIGAGALLAPDATVRFFGIDPDRSDRFIGRLFGSRELTLALALLAAPPEHVARAAAVGAVIDTVDAASGLAEWRRGNLSTRAKLLGPVGVLGVAAWGAYVAQEASQSGDPPPAR